MPAGRRGKLVHTDPDAPPPGTEPDLPGPSAPGLPTPPKPPRNGTGGGGGGGGKGFPNFDPTQPFGPPPSILTGGGFHPWSPLMPNPNGGGWSGQQPPMGWPPGMPPGMGGGGGVGPFPPAAPGDPMAGGVNAFQTYLSAVPMMEAARDKQIGEAMATAGFSGNRFGTASMQRAGEIGAGTALQQNNMLLNLLRDETQNTMNRGLQATGMGLQNEQFRNELALRASMGDRDAILQASQLGMQLGNMQDQQMQERIKMLQGFGAWEQGRQDQFSNMGFQQFNQDRLGTIPMILGALSGSSGSAQSPIQTQSGGGPGVIDYAIPIITAMIMASDERLKTNIRKVGEVPLPVYEWDWKDGSGSSSGVLAQELEQVMPEAVLTAPGSGLKAVDYGLLLSRVGSRTVN